MAEDSLEQMEGELLRRENTNPWIPDPVAGGMRYLPDTELLERLISIPIAQALGAESGGYAKAIDAWLSHELRRAGFGPDEVWPRLTQPRVLPRELGLFVNRLPAQLRSAVFDRLLRDKRVAPSDARVLGRAYVKQVDVLIAQWSRGPELLVSTKTMSGSYRKNLSNRFEEAYGDAKNLRGRYPLASMGYFFVMRSTVLDEPGSLERAIDMLRKLRDDQDAYDATGLAIAAWDSSNFDRVLIRDDAVPKDLRSDAFLSTVIDRVLERTPVDFHVDVRERREHREIAVEEEEGS